MYLFKIKMVTQGHFLYANCPRGFESPDFAIKKTVRFEQFFDFLMAEKEGFEPSRQFPDLRP